MFTEDVIEKMIIDSLVKNGWEYNNQGDKAYNIANDRCNCGLNWLANCLKENGVDLDYTTDAYQ